MAAPAILVPDIIIDQLDFFMLEFQQHDKLIYAGVAAVGPGAAYAMVWEWGNLRQTQQGPRTVMGVNPDGVNVWLSSQAPRGYIRVNEAQYWDIARRVLADLKFNQPDAKAMTAELEKGARKISRLMAQIVQETVPVGEGELQADIQPVEPNDPILEQADIEESGATILDEE